MSILLAKEIEEKVNKGDILIEPFIKENLAINSIDVRLSPQIMTYIPLYFIYNEELKTWETEKIKDNVILDMGKENKTYLYDIPKEGLILEPGILYLGSTIEKAGSSKYIPMYEGRSSMARLGIQSHISAGFGDLGFQSNWTLEINVVHRVKILPGIRIGQIYFHKITDKLEGNTLYKGKYINQKGPTASQSFKDF